MAPRPSSRRISYFPSWLIIAVVLVAVSQDGNAGNVPASTRTALRRSLVLAVDFPDRLLHEPLHHRVERHAALLRLRYAEHRRRLRADFHLLFGVTLRELLGG